MKQWVWTFLRSNKGKQLHFWRRNSNPKFVEGVISEMTAVPWLWKNSGCKRDIEIGVGIKLWMKNVWDDAEEDGSAECWKYQEELPINLKWINMARLESWRYFFHLPMWNGNNARRIRNLRAVK